jgi:hypothetical protein
MGWNGSGGFSRLYSWVADKAAGLNITASRMDADTNDIATNGFGNCLTRDGQGQPTANLPMAGFRHTNVGNGVARTDYSSMAQAQDGLIGWTAAGGSADALTATYTPGRGAPSDGALYSVRAASANLTTTPTFAPDGQTARTITRIGGAALVAGDLQANMEALFRYNSANTRWELLNPAAPVVSSPTTGDMKLTLKTAADSGWVMATSPAFGNGTIGSATSGSTLRANADCQALFILIFNNLSDTNAPIFTSGGVGTTRAAQGTAAAAWAANCRMSLGFYADRALAVAGNPADLPTNRNLGDRTGEETHLLTTGEIPSHTHVNTLTDPGHTHGGVAVSVNNYNSPGGATVVVQSVNFGNTSSATTGVTINNAAFGGGGAHNNMQPTVFVNVMVKL